MRRFRILAWAAFLETLSEPLTAVLFLISTLAIHLAGVFQYHRFGEAGRLARECGFSIVMVFGVIFATAASVRILRRELSEGTAAMAFAQGVSRTLFFVAKVCGVLTVLALLTLSIMAGTALAWASAIKGAELSLINPDTRLWGPQVALGILGPLMAFLTAALLNRFKQMRFCLSACLLTLLSQPLAWVFLVFAESQILSLTMRLLPPFLILFVGCSAFVSFTAALTMRLPPAPAITLMALAGVLSFASPIPALLPAFSAFWLVDGLANGGVVAWRLTLPPLAAGISLLAFWLLAGARLLVGKELP